MFINGEFVPSHSDVWMPTFNPSTGEPIASVPVADSRDVDTAVRGAQKAQRDWKLLPPLERGRVIREFAARVRQASQELGELDARNCGIPISAMSREVEYGADFLEYFAGLTVELKGESIPASPGNLHYTVREPYGVVGRIIPFNHPVMFACEKSAAPLAAGNAVILKPADQTPLSALRLAEIAEEVFPAGLFNVLTGDGPTTGAAVVTHPDLPRIAFTGGMETGREVLRSSAPHLKDVSLELGGKNPLIVFPDADLEAAATASVRGMNFHISAGQSCGSNSRIFVHEDVRKEFTELLIGNIRDIRLGNALDQETQMGPLVSADHCNRVLRYIKSGLEDGCQLLTGGSAPSDPALRGGFFVEPTVFDGVHPDMEIAQEEIFGPVVALFGWERESDMLAAANGVKYGLTANVWTQNLTSAHRTASALEAGYVWINGDGRHYLGTPFGGYKFSGLGREESIQELESYTRTKAVHVIMQ